MKTKNLAVGILAGVLVTALWYTMLLKPTRAKASKVKAQTATEQQRLAPLQHQLDQAQRDAAHAATFKAELQSLQLAMPDSPALAAFIRDQNNIAQEAGVSWQSVTHGPPTPGSGGEMSITMGIQVKGSYGEVVDYIGRLAGLQRLVIVDSVQLTTAPTTGATTGSTESSGGSTGPFSGATQISAVISARMFETPSAASSTDGSSDGTGVSTASAAPAASSPAPASGQTSTLNNS